MAGPYGEAIDATRDTIVRRARQYKHLVIIVSISGVLLLAAGLLLRSIWPLLMLTLLPGLVISHFVLDLRAVTQWRRETLALWSAGELQLDLLARTLQKVPTLPAQTVQGMLETLPDWPGEQVPLGARRTLADLQDRLARAAMQRLAGIGLAMGLGAAVLLIAIRAGMSTLSGAGLLWLVAGLAVPLLWLAVDLAVQWSVLRSCRNAVPRLQAHAGAGAAGDAAAADWLARLDWQGLPRKLGAEWRSAPRP